MLPDGDTLLFTAAPSADTPDRWANSQIVAFSLETKVRKVLVRGASDGWYVPSGHLLYMIGGGLFAVRFDLERLEPTGTVVQVVDGVRRANLTLGGVGLVQRLRLGNAGVCAGADRSGLERVRRRRRRTQRDRVADEAASRSVQNTCARPQTATASQ